MGHKPFQELRDKMTDRYPWMTEDQKECYEFLCDLYLGEHHLGGKLHEWGMGIRLNTHQTHRFASFDFDALTRAVVMAHDRCIRFSIEPSGPGMLGLVLHKRHEREGKIWDRHPTIETAIETIRGRK